MVIWIPAIGCCIKNYKIFSFKREYYQKRNLSKYHLIVDKLTWLSSSIFQYLAESRVSVSYQSGLHQLFVRLRRTPPFRIESSLQSALLGALESRTCTPTKITLSSRCTRSDRSTFLLSPADQQFIPKYWVTTEWNTRCRSKFIDQNKNPVPMYFVRQLFMLNVDWFKKNKFIFIKITIGHDVVSLRCIKSIVIGTICMRCSLQEDRYLKRHLV